MSMDVYRCLVSVCGKSTRNTKSYPTGFQHKSTEKKRGKRGYHWWFSLRNSSDQPLRPISPCTFSFNPRPDSPEERNIGSYGIACFGPWNMGNQWKLHGFFCEMKYEGPRNCALKGAWQVSWDRFGLATCWTGLCMQVSDMWSNLIFFGSNNS